MPHVLELEAKESDSRKKHVPLYRVLQRGCVCSHRALYLNMLKGVAPVTEPYRLRYLDNLLLFTTSGLLLIMVTCKSFDVLSGVE